MFVLWGISFRCIGIADGAIIINVLGVLQGSLVMAVRAFKHTGQGERNSNMVQGIGESTSGGAIAMVFDPRLEGSPVLGEPYIVARVVQGGIKVQDVDH